MMQSDQTRMDVQYCMGRVTGVVPLRQPSRYGWRQIEGHQAAYLTRLGVCSPRITTASWRGTHVGAFYRLPHRFYKQNCAGIRAQNRPDVYSPSPQQHQLGWKVFWSTVDVGAWMGALGSAAAFVVTQEALLVAGPLILPLIALYASNERNRIDAKAAQERVQQQVTQAVRHIVALSEEGAAEMAEEISDAVKNMKPALDEHDWKGVEDRLQALDASLEMLKESVKESGEGSKKNIRRSTDAVGEGLKKLRIDIRNDLQEATSEEVAALARLDTRLSALEGAISGLESAQTESLRRLTASLSSSMSLEEDAIASVVKAEVWRSLEPVRQLPQLLTQTLPTLSSESQYWSDLTEEGIKKILATELDNLKRSLVTEQQDLLEEYSQSTRIDPVQWNQLGKKLGDLDAQLSKICEMKDGEGETSLDRFAEIQAEFSSAMQQLETLSSQVKEFQAQVSFSQVSEVNVSQDVKESIRNRVKQGVSRILEDQNVSNQVISEEAEALVSALTDTLVTLVSDVSGNFDKESFKTTKESIDEVKLLQERVQELTSRLESMSGSEPADSNNNGTSTNLNNQESQSTTENIKESGTGVPIRSWLSADDKSSISEMETVEIKKQEEFEFDLPIVPKDMSGPSTVDQATEEGEFVQNDSDIRKKKDEVEKDGLSKFGMEDQKLNIDELLTTGSRLLKDGRALVESGELAEAEALLEEADICFQDILNLDPDNIKALGNRGNTLMARAKLKMVLASDLYEEDLPDDAVILEESAQDMLLSSGRLYRKILEIDENQGKAFINWGRVICLRAELTKESGDISGAYALFCNAADKFMAGIDALDPNNLAVFEGYRLAGTAYMEAYLCSEVLEPERADIASLQEAEKLLVRATAVNDSDLQLQASQKLEQCDMLLSRSLSR